MPTVDLTNAEHAEVIATIKRAIEEAHFLLARASTRYARPGQARISPSDQAPGSPRSLLFPVLGIAGQMRPPLRDLTDR